MGKYRYEQRPGFRITDKEAQVIGDAFEQCGSEVGSRGVSVEQFEAFCSKPRHPVHKVWKRRRDQICNGAGRTAAAYLMAAVRIIIIHPSAQLAAGRAFTSIQIKTEEEGGYRGIGYRSADVSNSPDLLDLAERDMDRQVRGLAEAFAAVAGGERMYVRLVRIASEVRELFTKQSTIKPKRRSLAKSRNNQSRHLEIIQME